MERVSIFSFKMRSLYIFVFRTRHFKFGQASYCQCSDTHTRIASSFNMITQNMLHRNMPGGQCWVLGARREWVVNFTPRPLYHRERVPARWHSGSVWMDPENLAPPPPDSQQVPIPTELTRLAGLFSLAQTNSCICTWNEPLQFEPLSSSNHWMQIHSLINRKQSANYLPR